MPHRDNFLLNRLEPALLKQLAPHLSMVHLEQGQVLAETHQLVQRVYFPHSGIISCVVELRGGGAIETGMIGNDGAWGASQALDGKVSLNHVVMQVPGTASRATCTPGPQRCERHYKRRSAAPGQEKTACIAPTGRVMPDVRQRVRGYGRSRLPENACACGAGSSVNARLLGSHD